MENIKKEKDISFVLDARMVTKNGLSFLLKATEQQCLDLAKFYELPALSNLVFDFFICLKDDLIVLKGFLDADVIETCVVTNEKFEEHIHQPVSLLFSEDESVVKMQESKMDFSPDEELIDFVENGRIYFSSIVREQFGLALNPFPKKTNEPFAYYEEKAQDIKDNPFLVLKHLTK